MVAITGRAEAYYSDTCGSAQELIAAAKYGFLFQGQHYDWQKQGRGTPALDLEPSRFVVFLQNHDQVANSARGLRGHQLTSPGRWRAATALLLLMPGTPMLFQGQEFSASTPFLYFADHDAELAANVRRGRAEFLTQFDSVAGYLAAGTLDDPSRAETFERCKLNLDERAAHAEAYALHRDLLELRRTRIAFRLQRPRGVDGTVLDHDALALRYFAERQQDDRLVIVNFGSDLRRDSVADPLIAPPAGCDWQIEWSSEAPNYGGAGVATLWPEGRWRVPGESATVLAPVSRQPSPLAPRRRRTA
jgi:maltooligosyltrehalose trehalohydrolase